MGCVTDLGGMSGNHFNQPYRVTDRVLRFSESHGNMARESV